MLIQWTAGTDRGGRSRPLRPGWRSPDRAGVGFYPWVVPGVGELVIMANPDEESSLRYLLRLPIGGGLVFRTAGTWPRTKALFCYPVPSEEWPEDGEVVERVPLRSCVRRGAAIEVVADRARENRSQLVFTRGRVGTWCPGSRPGPSSRPVPTWRCRKPGPPAWPTSRSSSIPGSATPTDSAARR
jgi:hypothetical protein